MQKTIAATLLLATAGCGSAPSPTIGVEDHSIRWVWQTSPLGFSELVLVDASPTVPAPQRGASSVAIPQPALTTAAPTNMRRPAPATISQTHPRAQPALSAPKAHARAAQGKAVVPPKVADLKRREQELTLRYASGDLPAAVDLARLLYDQGRTKSADTVLDYAVRKNYTPALLLKAERQQAHRT